MALSSTTTTATVIDLPSKPLDFRSPFASPPPPPEPPDLVSQSSLVTCILIFGFVVSMVVLSMMSPILHSKARYGRAKLKSMGLLLFLGGSALFRLNPVSHSFTDPLKTPYFPFVSVTNCGYKLARMDQGEEECSLCLSEVLLLRHGNGGGPSYSRVTASSSSPGFPDSISLIMVLKLGLTWNPKLIVSKYVCLSQLSLSFVELFDLNEESSLLVSPLMEITSQISSPRGRERTCIPNSCLLELPSKRQVFTCQMVISSHVVKKIWNLD